MTQVDKDSAASYKDNIATVDKQGKRMWIFPQKPKGTFYNARTLLSYLYVLVFFTLPFVKWNGRPLFLANVIDRKFILFGKVFWPQDFILFGIGMVIFVIFIALFTFVFGRVFCGWICPQTIFMEMIFRRIEYLIEGDGNAQRMLKNAPWNTDKITKKLSKWAIFWLVSFLIANTFLSYIIGVDQLLKIITEPLSEHVGGFVSIAIFTTVFFFVYSWFREQVCTVVCPYGRLQGVLLSKQSLVVAYDYVRGETRGKFNKKVERTIGDCIDCGQCVKVCPTGIDIRNGTQLECTNCTACIDACNKMMDAVGLPQNLIRYASEESIEQKKPFVFSKKMKGLAALMMLLLTTEGVLLATRKDVGVSILRTAGQLYQTQPNHRISNLYNYKMVNKSYREKTIELRPENFKGEIKIVGEEQLVIPKEDYTSGALFISMDSLDVKQRKTRLDIGVYEAGKKIRTVSTSFLGPFR